MHVIEILASSGRVAHHAQLFVARFFVHLVVGSHCERHVEQRQFLLAEWPVVPFDDEIQPLYVSCNAWQPVDAGGRPGYIWFGWWVLIRLARLVISFTLLLTLEQTA